jgi:hypothetical protein
MICGIYCQLIIRLIEKKLDKIPSDRLLERRKIAIFKMWDILNTTYEVRFFKEIKI